MKAFKKSALLVAVGLMSVSAFAADAFAASARDRATGHFEAIGKGAVEAILADYADNATLYWIGGPLDGVHAGKASIETVWRKFTGAQGPLKVEVSDVAEHANPKGSTVSANVKFLGKGTVPVHYVLTYHGDRLVSEIWQIDPKLAK
ncbi:nuclear transport factor 2 family protein [Nisaea sediminum]|uniref:nuclear transport factor 2 family protein n=1 Tax=Nisaea sediminum TaxID=2775867 RepID=UPI001D0176BA|nr:nuclear transport factor 2 family protein [Nisaea sediminum]